MKRLALALGFVFWASAAFAQYAGIRVVTTCGAPSPWPALQTNYQPFAVWLSVDTTMTLCTTAGGGGGGGGAVTAVAGAYADGALVTMGLTTDTVWSGTGAGTEIAILKKIATGSTGTVSVSNFPATQAISAASLPLPTGAATAVNQEVTVAGTSATSGQGVQGLTGGVPFPVKSGQYTSAGASQFGISLTSIPSLTVPAGTTAMQVCVETAAARYTTDGATTPTSTVGVPVAIGGCFQLALTTFANFKIIGASAVGDFEYFK